MHELNISPPGRNTTRPRDSAGFQVSATRSERASDPGSGPGSEAARAQHRVRAAARCAHSGRPTGTGTRHGHRSAEAPRIKFHGAGISGPRGSGPRGGRHLKLQLVRVSCHRHQSHWRPTRASAQRLSVQCPQPGEKIQHAGANRRAAGRTSNASCLFANGRGHQNGGAGLDL